MVKCEGCGKPIDKIPTWMDSIQVSFVCNNCPNRQMKNIAQIVLETTPSVQDKPDDPLAGEDEDGEPEADA